MKYNFLTLEFCVLTRHCYLLTFAIFSPIWRVISKENIVIFKAVLFEIVRQGKLRQPAELLYTTIYDNICEETALFGIFWKILFKNHHMHSPIQNMEKNLKL